MKSQTLSLSIGDKRHFEEIGLADFDGIARIAQRDTSEVRGWISTTIERARTALDGGADGIDFTTKEREILRRHIDLLPLVRA
jgi:hypothetical protein